MEDSSKYVMKGRKKQGREREKTVGKNKRLEERKMMTEGKKRKQGRIKDGGEEGRGRERRGR